LCRNSCNLWFLGRDSNPPANGSNVLRNRSYGYDGWLALARPFTKAESGASRWLWLPLFALIAAVLLFSLWPRSWPAAFNVRDQVRTADKAAAALAA